MYVHSLLNYVRQSRLGVILVATVIPILALLALWQTQSAGAAGGLTVSVVAGYNLVVDSNVLSPSTYAPSVATVMGKFCNTGVSTLNDVQAFIGDYDSVTPANSTPGTYPSRGSGDTGFNTTYPHLAGTPGRYSFVHVGGQIGTLDATRYIGDLAVGECKVQYWHFAYPRRSNLATSNDNAGPDPVWGETNSDSDDLSLSFDIWGQDSGGSANDNVTWTMTMRNEISAMANKIEPNPSGQWFNTDTNTVQPGQVITSNGVLYDLGNINQGFDNDGDFDPDYNAWMQPIGDPSYDPSCFRLIRTTGVVTVSRSAMPDMYIHFTDQLYFTDLPVENNGAIGNVRYTFLALNGPCNTALTPYQEVASGFNNEKFNADFGAGIPPVVSNESDVTVDKSSSPNVIALGGTTTYSIVFQNNGTTSSPSLPLSSGTLPIVISDTVPAGMQYVGGSASSSLAGVTILYSTDSGDTWSTTDPGTTTSTSPSSLVRIQWWLGDQLAASASGTVSFQASVPLAYTGTSFIENDACGSFGNGSPFYCDSTSNMVSGNNSIGDFVWNDLDADGIQDGGGETGISGITVSLYHDSDGDGLLDSGEPLITTTATNGSGIYGFSTLPDGYYIVVVDDTDPQIPTGYTSTTATELGVGLDPTSATGTAVNYTLADFGFGPALNLDKTLTSANPSYEGQTVTYTIDLTNNLPSGTANGDGFCEYTVWASTEASQTSGLPNNQHWDIPANAFGASGPDGLYAESPWSNSRDQIAGTGYTISPQPGSFSSVEAIFYIYLTGSVTNDNAEGFLFFNGSSIGTTTFSVAQLNPFTPIGNAGLLVWDVTSAKTWAWSDFTGDLDLQIDATKSGATDGPIIRLDAMGFRITTNQSCGSDDDTINPLPLTDTFDDTKLQFVSASPSASSVSGGTITWNNLGPLYAGDTLQVTLTFLALEPPGNVTTSHTNTATSTGATFANGLPANSATDSVTHNINPTGSIGDTIWNDNGNGGGTSGNGIQDGGEAGIPGVTVYLCTSLPCNSGTATETTTTDSNGNYLFDALLDGNYYVAVDTTSLPGTTFTQTGDPDASCPNPSCDNRSNAVTIASANDNLVQDFGYTIPNTLYGTVWEDNSGDGVQQTGENGLSGVTVYLCTSLPCNSGTAVVSTTTDANGGYVFSDRPDNTYYIAVDTTTLPAGATWGQTDDPDATLDSLTGPIVVSGGNVYGSYDFGYHRSGSSTIGDTLYVDWNGDGDQDSGEEGIANVTIYLYEDNDGDGVVDSGTDSLITTDVTDGNGNYLFTGLAAGNYIVVVDESDAQFPSAYVQTQDPDEAGVCATCDGQSAVTGVDGVSNYLNEDFGYQPIGTGTIGDFVWEDTNHNGAQDSGEPGIANITVNLYEDSNANGIIDANDALIATTTTDSNGLYGFTGLAAARYLVDVDTTDTDLPNDGYGNNYTLTTDNDPHLVVLSAGEDYVDADFGFGTGGVIGDLVWRDDDGDGTLDGSEPGISGITVRLYVDVNSDGDYDVGTDTLYATDTTDSSGIYEFTGLPAGDYVVVVDTGTLPAGYTNTGDPDEQPPCTVCNSQSGVSLSAGQIDRSRDFGYQPVGYLGDTLWIDADNDDVRDSNESGIGYITVNLCSALPCSGGNIIATTETDSDGYYSFGGLSNGTYYVAADTTDGDFPAGLSNTYDPDGTTDSTTQVIISGGAVSSIGGSACANCALDVDFGYQYSGSQTISGTVFFDALNNGGLYSIGTDTPIEGVPVYLWNSTGDLVATTTTDANGFYSFSNLPNGTFTVSVNNGAPQVDLLNQTSEPDNLSCGVCNNYTTIVLAGGDDTNNDFGFYAAIDCGDAPSGYNTYLANQGPCHLIGDNYLGAGLPDADTNGQPNGSATGDDTGGSDDEDGISRSTAFNWSPGNAVQLTAQVGGTGGYLIAWFDWNNDGDFDDLGELKVFGSVAAGSNTLNMTLPMTYTVGQQVVARFRLYDGAPTSFGTTGMTSDGEVEDYLWTFGPTAISLSQMTTQTTYLLPMLFLVCLLGLVLVSRLAFKVARN